MAIIQPQNPQSHPLGLMVSEGLMRQKLLSGSSEALICFAGQGFSEKLQVYLVNYVTSISSYYPLYA